MSDLRSVRRATASCSVERAMSQCLAVCGMALMKCARRAMLDLVIMTLNAYLQRMTAMETFSMKYLLSI